MQTETVIEQCDKCNGSGTYTDGGDDYIYFYGCERCGGKGWDDSSRRVVNGSGKVKNTYELDWGMPLGSSTFGLTSKEFNKRKKLIRVRLISSEPAPSGGCFLTTAACIFKGLPDDCEELTILRQFRDEYLSSSVSGRALISEYYETAPTISQMMTEQDMESTFLMIQQCVTLIKANNNEAALSLYKSVFQVMRDKYIGSRKSEI